MNETKRRELEITDLKTGDLLLSMSDSEIGKMIAWLGNAKFSHASVVYDADALIEASPPKVRLAPLAERVRKANVEFIEVLRPRAGFTTGDEGLLRACGLGYIDHGYATDALVPLAVAALARKATTFHPLVHRLLKWLIHHEISRDPARLVCTELAYRLYDEAGYPTPHTPQLQEQPAVTLPFPLVNPIKLAREIRELAGQAAINGLAQADASAGELDAILGELEALGGDEHALAPAPALQAAPADPAFDAYCAGLWREWTAGAANGAVNPKAVLLLELWKSPSFEPLGRLHMYR